MNWSKIVLIAKTVSLSSADFAVKKAWLNTRKLVLMKISPLIPKNRFSCGGDNTIRISHARSRCLYRAKKSALAKQNPIYCAMTVANATPSTVIPSLLTKTRFSAMLTRFTRIVRNIGYRAFCKPRNVPLKAWRQSVAGAATMRM